MTPELLDLLRACDTPTVCNAIEVVEGRRGFDRFTVGAPYATGPAFRIVGRAVTAEIAARRPPQERWETVRTRRRDYYRMVATAPAPAVAVIADRDVADGGAVGAFWGEINASIHAGFGLAGVLTDGLVRDLDELPTGFPILAGGVGVSHAFVHVTALGQPVRVLGLEVRPGDLIHADRHGAVVVPEQVLPDLADGLAGLRETEAIVLDAARAADFDLAAFEAAWARFEAART